MFKCGICGLEVNGVNQYVLHVEKCSEELKKKINVEDQEAKAKVVEMNKKLEELKKLKESAQAAEKVFKHTYPEVYKMNFPSHGCKCESTGKTCPESVENELEKEDTVKIVELTLEEFLSIEDFSGLMEMILAKAK